MVTWVYKRLIKNYHVDAWANHSDHGNVGLQKVIKYDHMVRWVNISNHGNVRLQEVNKI